MGLKTSEIETIQSEKEFLDILFELIDDRIWLDAVLHKDKLHSPHNFNLTTTEKETLEEVEVMVDKVKQRVIDAEQIDSDLEETIIVSRDLSLEQYPYQKSLQKGE